MINRNSFWLDLFGINLYNIIPSWNQSDSLHQKSISQGSCHLGGLLSKDYLQASVQPELSIRQGNTPAWDDKSVVWKLCPGKHSTKRLTDFIAKSSVSYTERTWSTGQQQI